LLGVVCGLVGLAPMSLHAQPKAAATEQQHAAAAIEKALQKHGGDVHGCFAKVLADRLDRAGKVEVAVEVGKGGKVKRAKVQKLDKSAGPALAACIEKAAQSWTIDGIDAGSTVILPFSFKAQSSQYVVNAADVSDRSSSAGAHGKGPARPRRAPPFTVKVLADEQNVKAKGIALTVLTIGPASRVAMQRHPHSGKILYLLRGHGRLLGPAGVAPLKMEEGTAVYIPPGYPHAIENMGRQASGTFLQAFSPPGPERVYRNPKDPRGRAEFEVIRDPAKAKAPEGQALAVVEGKPVELANKAGTMTTLASGGGMSAVKYELADGAELRSPGSTGTELIYMAAGGGTIKIAGETLPLAADSLIHVPRGTAYQIKVAAADKNEKVVAVQFKQSAVRKAGAAQPPQ
jgi:quercetin dioxygenase-like cupin family protein